jgi:hypothetical protein
LKELPYVSSLDFPTKVILDFFHKFKEISNKKKENIFRGFLLKNPSLYERPYKEILGFFVKQNITGFAPVVSKRNFLIKDPSKKLQFFLTDISFNQFVKSSFLDSFKIYYLKISYQMLYILTILLRVFRLFFLIPASN